MLLKFALSFFGTQSDTVLHDNLGNVKYKRHEFDNEIEIVAKALMITSGHNTGHKFFTRLGNR